ncbi:R27-2 protein, partial [Trypanosoma cruzi]
LTAMVEENQKQVEQLRADHDQARATMQAELVAHREMRNARINERLSHPELCDSASPQVPPPNTDVPVAPEVVRSEPFYCVTLDELNKTGTLNEQLTRALAQREADNEKLTEELAQREADNEKLAEELVQREADNEKLTEELAQREADNEKLTEELAQREADNEKLAEELAQREADNEKLTEDLAQREADNEKLAEDLAQREADNEKLTEELAQREADNEKLTEELAQREADIEKLAEDLAQREADNEKLAEDLAQREAVIEGAEADASKTIEGVYSRCRELEELAARRELAATGDVDILERELADALVQLKALEGENAALAALLAAKKAEMVEASDAAGKSVRELESRLSAAVSEASHERAMAEKLISTTRGALTAMVEENQKQVEQLRADHDQARATMQAELVAHREMRNARINERLSHPELCDSASPQVPPPNTDVPVAPEVVRSEPFYCVTLDELNKTGTLNEQLTRALAQREADNEKLTEELAQREADNEKLAEELVQREADNEKLTEELAQREADNREA